MIRTCLLVNGETIGWANVARFPEFRAFLAQRIAQGYAYRIMKVMSREVIYNNATKINRGCRPHALAIVARDMPDFLEAGDVSIMAVRGTEITARETATIDEILDNDTIEIGAE